MCKKSTCEDAICMCIDGYLTVKNLVKKVDTLYKSKVDYSL